MENLEKLQEKYPNPDPSVVQQYGTAGFRNKADRLFHVTFRTGILATLRSIATKAITGVMITASHNPEADNGLKIIEPDGSMLHQEWEKSATLIANVSDSELRKCITDIVDQYGLNLENSSSSLVYVARDTRKSSPALAEALIDGIKVIGGKFIDFKLLTTPQLHFIVRCSNDIRNGKNYGKPTENGYYEKIGGAFLRLTEDCVKESLQLTIDCANGVGSIAMKNFQPYLKDRIKFDLVNDGDGTLNHRCGADFVKVNQVQPDFVEIKIGQRYASFDGDADRVVFYYRNQKDDRFHLLDGDKIAVLVAKFLKESLEQAGLSDVEITVVQTAYANGSSTHYIRDVLKLTTDCVPTGVKHLHHRALQAQIGVYFEANGHGTIVFSESTQKQIIECPDAKKLVHFIDLINQTVGDAISDTLAVEAILANLGMTIEQWDSLYTDLPNRLLKVSVKDRNVITTTDAERRCVTPAGLQDAIDKTVKQFGPRARSFIRPSGTEDVVRIYAEAETQNDADTLAKLVANLVYDFANGVGEKF